MKKLVLGLVLCLTFNVAQAAPHHGGSNFLQGIFDRIASKLSEIKNNVGHNLSHGGSGGGGGVCR